FRLTVVERLDLTAIRLAGRLREEAVTSLRDTCDRARRPLVLDLSELTGASDAGVLLLRRLAGEGIHLLGASPYVSLLLAVEREVARGTSHHRKRGPGKPRRPGGASARRREPRS